MTTLTPDQQEQLLTPNVARILNALHEMGEARVVGGAVRDVLLGRKIGDIDLATTLPPERVMEILAAQNIKTVPTGLTHGTITAVVDHVGYEITTLRRDVHTDGRHAEIAFTDDWREDAARRDFTFNALYVDAAGTLYDYFDGTADAKAGRVRFIGNAPARIREDHLRILRFFRFFAFFGQGAADAEALTSCRDLSPLIADLSAERVAREILKMLTAENPAPAWTLMQKCGATQFFAAEANDTARLQNLLDHEKRSGLKATALARLASLLPQKETAAQEIAARLKLSKRDGEELRILSTLPAVLAQDTTPLALRRALYEFGADACRNATLLSAAPVAAFALIDAWENPVFPIKGEDLLHQGIPHGPRIGEILREVEHWWIASDFRADRAACLARAKGCSGTV